MRKFFSGIFPILFLLLPVKKAAAQELQANVTVVSNRIKNTDQKVFQTLQAAIKEFLNTRKWTDDNFLSSEKIECNFLLNIKDEVGDNTYSAQLTIQSVRPVYSSNYKTSMLNYQDVNVTFKYLEFQPLEFNENRIAGNDPLKSNLTAILAYYAYIVIGLDYDSFSPRGGIPYFQKAQNIVSNAPEDTKNISGWKAFESNRNRYWLADQLLNNHFSTFHEVMYQYHRMGLDKMYDDMNAGRKAILSSLNLLSALNSDNPDALILHLFFLSKSDELIGIFSQAPLPDKQRARQLLTQMDIPNASKYQEQLK